MTLMPSVSAACGFSPHDRTRSPHGVREQHEPRQRHDHEHREEDRLVREELLADHRDASTAPASRSPTCSRPSRSRVGTITCDRRKLVRPSASRLITTPEMIWSTRNVTEHERVQRGDEPAGEHRDHDRRSTASPSLRVAEHHVRREADAGRGQHHALDADVDDTRSFAPADPPSHRARWVFPSRNDSTSSWMTFVSPASDRASDKIDDQRCEEDRRDQYAGSCVALIARPEQADDRGEHEEDPERDDDRARVERDARRIRVAARR